MRYGDPIFCTDACREGYEADQENGVVYHMHWWPEFDHPGVAHELVTHQEFCWRTSKCCYCGSRAQKPAPPMRFCECCGEEVEYAQALAEQDICKRCSMEEAGLCADCGVIVEWCYCNEPMD